MAFNANHLHLQPKKPGYKPCVPLQACNQGAAYPQWYQNSKKLKRIRFTCRCHPIHVSLALLTRGFPRGLARERTEEIKRWIHLASSLAGAERHLKENMSSRRRQVLQGKNLLLFKTLMEDAMHRDSDLVDQLASGFDLTGNLPESQVFARKLRPATMSCVELRRISDIRIMPA